MPGKRGANDRVEIRDLGMPAEQLGCKTWVGDQYRRIAGPSRGFAARDGFAANRLGSPDNLAHRVTAAGAEVERRALPPGAEMLKGRSAIEAFWRQQMQQIGDVKCTALDVRRLGRDAAREIGTCSFKTKAQPPQEGALKYAVVWEKEGNQWRLLQDIWNTNK